MNVNINIKLRQLKNTKKDYKLLEKWYQEKEVYSNFEQRKLNYQEIEQKYYPRTLKNAKIPVYMIEFDNEPVGIIQYQLVNKDNKELYNLDCDNIYEIDIFIGEIKEHHKGIGTCAINLLSEFLFKEKNAKFLVMCPLETNYKAIKCYEKCGFYLKKSFKAEDTIGNIQNYVLMIKEQ